MLGIMNSIVFKFLVSFTKCNEVHYWYANIYVPNQLKSLRFATEPQVTEKLFHNLFDLLGSSFYLK